MGRYNRPDRKSIGLGLFLVCLLTFALSACSNGKPGQSALESIQQRGKLIAGVKYDSKPFGYLDADGQLKGYDIDLMRELARRILGNAQAVEFQQVLSSTRVVAINTNTVDVVAATMTITPEREKLIDFSVPYFTAHQAIIVPADSPVKNLAALQGKTILFVLGTTSEKNIKKRLPDAKYKGFKTSTDAFSALKAGRGDAMTTDDTILYGFLAEECRFRLLNEKLSEEPYGLGLRQDKDHQSTDTLTRRINQSLEQMKADGTLDRLQKKWLKTAPCHERPHA